MYCYRRDEEEKVTAVYSLSCEPRSVPVDAEPAVLSHPLHADVEIAPGYAGFWYRAVALLIDTVIYCLVTAVVALFLGFAIGVSMSGSASMAKLEMTAELVGNLVGLLISWLYFTLMESSGSQATFGKKMLGLKVTDETGKRIGFVRANGRYWSKIISATIAFIGYFIAAFTQKKQTLHDKIAGTLVLRK